MTNGKDSQLRRDIQIRVNPIVGGLIVTIGGLIVAASLGTSKTMYDTTQTNQATIQANAEAITRLTEMVENRPTYNVMDLTIGRLRDRVDSLEGRLVDLRDQMRGLRGGAVYRGPYRREYMMVLDT